MISLTTIRLPILLPLVVVPVLLSICSCILLEQQRHQQYHVFCEGLPILPTIVPTVTRARHTMAARTSIPTILDRITRQRRRRTRRDHHHQLQGCGDGLGIRTTALTTATEMYSSNGDDCDDDGGGGGIRGGGGGGGGIFLTRKNFFVRLVQSFLVVTPFLTELYSRLGSMFPNTQLPSGEDLISQQQQQQQQGDGGESSSPSPATVVDWDKVRHITLVFHGAGGQDQYTDELMTNLKKNYEQQQQTNAPNNSKEQQRPLSSSSPSSSYCQIIEWSDYSTNLFQASYNGEAIGRIVAEYLSPKAKNVETVHLIGISVGAYAANMAATNWKQQQRQQQQQQQQQTGKGNSEDGYGSIATSSLSSIPQTTTYVQLTLLDPFTQRGIFGIGYGQKNFGSSPDIDYTQQYLNTDDPVPSTNLPLPNAVCYDVTSVRPPEIFGHDWPLAYYAKRLQSAATATSAPTTATENNVDFTEIVSVDERKSPGQVISVNSLN